MLMIRFTGLEDLIYEICSGWQETCLGLEPLHQDRDSGKT